MFRKSLAVALGMFASICHAATLDEILEAQDRHIADTYGRAQCHFKFYDSNKPDRPLHTEGTIVLDGEKRRLTVRQKMKSMPSGEYIWVDSAYSFEDGRLFKNLAQNRVTSEIPARSVPGQTMLFKSWGPWDPHACVAGDGMTSLRDLAADPVNSVEVIRLDDGTAAVDIRRGGAAVTTLFLDPGQGYVVRKLRSTYAGNVIQSKTLLYDEASHRVIRIENEQRGGMNFVVDYTWADLPEDASAGTSPADITAEGHLLVAEADGKKVVMRKAGGEVRVAEDVVFAERYTDPTATQPSSAPAGENEPAVTQPSGVSDSKDYTLVYVGFGIMSVFAVIAGAILFSRKGTR